jgi:hypothetical protein
VTFQQSRAQAIFLASFFLVVLAGGVAAFVACLLDKHVSASALLAPGGLVLGALGLTTWCVLCIWRPQRIRIDVDGLWTVGARGSKHWQWSALSDFRVSPRSGVVFSALEGGKPRFRSIGSGWPNGDAAMVERLRAATDQYARLGQRDGP